MNRSMHSLLALLAAALLSACAGPSSRVTLLPNADGRPSAVEVKGAGGSQRLDKPYQTASIQRDGTVEAGTVTPLDVFQRYGRLMALQPPGPQKFVLQFERGTSQLTPESLGQVEPIIAQAKSRKGGEIVVVGHTDRVGKPEANDALSLQRAQAIRDIVVSRGFAKELVEAVGRGEREPVVPTEPNVDEPRNRRAEIFVR